MALVFALLVAFQIKHFLADYPWQTPYMLQKFAPGWEYVKPLAAHAGVHAFLTFLISFFTVSYKNGHITLDLSLWALGAASFDFVAHFIMDRIKASPKLLGRFKALSAAEMRSTRSIFYLEDMKKKPLSMTGQIAQQALRGNTYFWWSLGADQMVHHLTHYAIIFALLSA